MAEDTIFSTLPPCSYGGITIPLVSVEYVIDCAGAMHKYPQRAGVDIEYTGREPIHGSMVAAFFNGVGQFSGNHSTSDLWPGSLQLLQKKVQENQSFPLVIPVLGTIQKAKLKLHCKFDPEHQDGCSVTIEFIEDSRDQFSATLPQAQGRAKSAAIVADAKLAEIGEAADVPDLSKPGEFADVDDNRGGLSDFTHAIENLLGFVQAIQDDVARPFLQAAALVERATELLETSKELANPLNIQAVDAIRTLLDATETLMVELTDIRKLKTYVTSTVMSVAMVAIATNNKVEDILSLNPLEDPNAIEEGTSLLVYS